MSGGIENPCVTAFFDVDGTLLAPPALERRFFRVLWRHRAIPPSNYLLWFARAAKLVRQGASAIAHANKMYLRGVRTDSCDWLPRGSLTFFPGALARAGWHAARGHAIVLVTGTLAPLAQNVAVALALRLAVRGTTASIGVCATRLEEADGRWTGRILGQAMFGQAKALAIQRFAKHTGLDLARCYAYGDSTNDRWMLHCVGHPVATNPSADLDRTAQLHGWPVLQWNGQAPIRREPPHAGAARQPTETCG
jgi:HAD superfamily hydrolase (TIGR01490 family)